MKRILGIFILAITMYASAVQAETSPYYAGAQVGNGIGILGGVQIDKMFSAELSYTNYGNRPGFTKCGFTNCGSYSTASSIGLYGVGVFPLNIKELPLLSAFGKVGVLRTSVSASNGTTTYTATDFGLSVGGGLQYEIIPELSARLGVELNNNFSDDLYIGVIYKF